MSRAQASSQLATKTTVKDAIQRAQSGNAFQLFRAQASSQLASLPTAKLRINLDRAKENGRKICECVKTYKKRLAQITITHHLSPNTRLFFLFLLNN
jgi:hypothetical protein